MFEIESLINRETSEGRVVVLLSYGLVLRPCFLLWDHYPTCCTFLTCFTISFFPPLQQKRTTPQCYNMPPKSSGYGITPWGQAIQSKLDSMGGRLDRGLTLARTGKVYDVHRAGTLVRCKVKVSPPLTLHSTYYHI